MTNNQTWVARLKGTERPFDQATDELKAHLALTRQPRSPLYLTTAESDAVVRWKLGGLIVADVAQL